MAKDEKTKRDEKFEKELITGLISLILLAITNNSGEAMYGYQIAKQMETENETHVQLKQGDNIPRSEDHGKERFVEKRDQSLRIGAPKKILQDNQERS